MYMYAWKGGIKTTCYLRSRPATKIAKPMLAALPDQTQVSAAVVCRWKTPSAAKPASSADQRFARLDMPKKYGAKNPLDFMDLLDVQEVASFFERGVSAYQVGVQGEVTFDMAF